MHFWVTSYPCEVPGHVRRRTYLIGVLDDQGENNKSDLTKPAAAVCIM
jgi:hypothetical protein